MATITIATLMMLSLAFLQVSRAASNEVLEQVDQASAFYLAEAGVAEAIEALRSGATGNVGTPQTPAFLANGVVWIEATDIGNNQTRLVATGLKGSGRAALEVVVGTGGGGTPMFPGLMMSKERVDLDQGMTIDSYDSSVGSYVAQAVNFANGRAYANDNGHVHSNAEIDLDVNAGIFGDAIPGLGFTTTLGGGSSFVSGSTLPALEPFSVAPVVVPVIASSGSLNVAGSQTIPSGDHAFDALTIQATGTLTIEGPANVVISDFDTINDAELVIDSTNGPVTIYATATFHYDEKFIVSTASGSPADLVWVITETCNPAVPDDHVGVWDSYIEFQKGAVVVGGIYAPNTFLDFNRNCTVYGAFACRKVDMDRDLYFHYDEFLSNRTIGDGGGGGGIEIVSWNPIGLPDEVPVGDRRDPFSMLGLDKANLPKPVDAWDMPY